MINRLSTFTPKQLTSLKSKISQPFFGETIKGADGKSSIVPAGDVTINNNRAQERGQGSCGGGGGTSTDPEDSNPFLGKWIDSIVETVRKKKNKKS